MGSIRVLVVDDSVVIRRLVSEALTAEGDIEVVGAAANGRVALEQLGRLSPDVVTLDIEMPEMDGLQTLGELRKTHPRLPVIMFSTLTERGAMATIDALSRGANDYVTKPSGAENLAASMGKVRSELVPKIRALAARAARMAGGARAAAPSASTAAPGGASTGASSPAPAKPAAPRRIDVIAIGISTGGPNALAELIPALPKGLPVPVLICQHMPPMFTRLLAERLSVRSDLPVFEGQAGMPLRAGEIYIAPGDWHMVAERGDGAPRIGLNQQPAENSCRPAVDVLFRSIAQVWGGNALAVVMTGMGQDGLRGCQLLREKGAQILAQDEASSVVWGMPAAVAKAGLADKIVPLGELAREIAQRVQQLRTCALPDRSNGRAA